MTRYKEILPGCPGYWISDDGRVFSSKVGHSNKSGKWMELSLVPGKDGYLRVNVYGRHRKRFLMVSRLVCFYFNGAPPNDGREYQAAHLDTDKTNNNYWNLEWQTQSKNMRHPITRARNSAAKKSAYARGEIPWLRNAPKG
jgi:hypothetical protein